jgi:hypothetical protein
MRGFANRIDKSRLLFRHGAPNVRQWAAPSRAPTFMLRSWRAQSSACGLLPILWNEGTGSEVMQRIAVPMIGGMASSTLLTLLVIPAIYRLVKGWQLGTESKPTLNVDSRPASEFPAADRSASYPARRS